MRAKCYVSDYILRFKNGKEYSFIHIKDETIRFTADGLIEIDLINATVPEKEFIELIKSKNVEIDIEQVSEFRDLKTGDDYKETWFYENFKIQEISLLSSADDVAEFNLTLTNCNY